jgi:tetratricopeptide (TPR) repeat protein
VRKNTLIVSLSLLSVMICIGTIAWANSGQPESKDILEQANELRHAQKYSEAEKLYNQVKAENPGSDKALEAQKQLIHLAIDKTDLKQADTSFSQMVTEFAENTGLAEAVYEIGKDYQYSIWNTAKANQAHNYNIEHFPDTKYAMLSNVELIRSYIRDGKSTADTEADKWMNTYKDQPDRAMGIYLIARAYAGNNRLSANLFATQPVRLRMPPITFKIGFVCTVFIHLRNIGRIGFCPAVRCPPSTRRMGFSPCCLFFCILCPVFCILETSCLFQLSYRSVQTALDSSLVNKQLLKRPGVCEIMVYQNAQ